MLAMCLEILSPLVQEGSKVMGGYYNINVMITNKLLDVGSGSGYLTACLARLAGESGKVVGLETVPQLVNDSKENINRDCPEFLTSGRVLIKRLYSTLLVLYMLYLRNSRCQWMVGMS